MKATRTRKVQTNKANYMSDEAFGDLKEALEGTATRKIDQEIAAYRREKQL